MQRLRSTWWKRGLVAVLAISLLPIVAGPRAGTASETAAAHASWLRAQMTGTLSADAQTAVNAALEAASEDAAPTLRAFTRAFADAYQSQSAPVTLAALFAAPSLEDDALYEVLSRRMLQMSRMAVLPRLSAGTATAATVSGRSAAAVTTSAVPRVASTLAAGAVTDPVHRVFPCILRTLFSARPMAP